ncbi:tetratricopeptide repeat protein [Planctomycetota bacterium]
MSEKFRYCKIYRFLGLLLIGLSVLLIQPRVLMALDAKPGEQQVIPEKILEAVKSVVTIFAFNKEPRDGVLGTGIMLPDFRILTANHVVEGKTNWEVLQGEDIRFPAKRIVAGNAYYDLAILEVAPEDIPESLQWRPVTIGSVDDINAQKSVYGIGTSTGTFATKILIAGQSAPIFRMIHGQPGDSGGAVFTEDGHLIGTIVLMDFCDPWGYAVPVTYVSKFLENLALEAWFPGELETFEDNFMWGFHAHVKEQWQHCVRYLRAADRKQPNNSEVLAILGLSLAYKQSLYEAKSVLENAVELDPECAPAYFGLGITQQEMKLYEEAEKSFKHAIELKDKFAAPYYSLGLVHFDQKHWTRTVEIMEKYLELEPNQVMAQYYIGLAYFNNGNNEKAFTALLHAEHLAPDFVPAQFQLGRVFASGGEVKLAAMYFAKVILREPDNMEAYLGLGKAQALGGDLKKAGASFREMLRIEGKALDEILIKGMVKYHARDMSAAMDLLTKALEKNPASIEAHFLMGCISADHGWPKLALEHFTSALKHDAKCAKVYYHIALVHYENKDYVAAQRALTSADNLDYYIDSRFQGMLAKKLETSNRKK